MAVFLQATTELEAVNSMLRAIGSSPVSTLENNGVVDAVIALQTLRDVSRDVQSQGWHFNSETNYPIAPTYPLPGELVLPANCLRVDPCDPWTDLVQRGTRLYDPVNHTYAFDSAVKVDMVVLLGFEELPQYARRYIAIKAARIFQMSVVGSDTLDQGIVKEELKAHAAFRAAEAENADYNMLTGSYSVLRVLDREDY